MSSLGDWGIGSGGTPLGLTAGYLTPQFRLNETLPALEEDSSIANTRSMQDFTQRTLPDLANQGAAMGQIGSSGLQNRADRATQDFSRGQFDVNRMLARNVANIQQQRVLAGIGSYAGALGKSAF